MKILINILFVSVIPFSYQAYGQIELQNLNPYLKIVNMDEYGNTNPVAALSFKKVNHESAYDSLSSFDFDGNGIKEIIYYSLGSQSSARFFIEHNQNKNLVTLHDDYFDVPDKNEGFWFYLLDLTNDNTPEIVVFQKIGEQCSLDIFYFAPASQSYNRSTYLLNELALFEHLLVKNERKIYSPEGSQGLYTEINLDLENESYSVNQELNSSPNDSPELVMETIFTAAKTGEVQILQLLLPPINPDTGLRPCDNDCLALCNPGDESKRAELGRNYISIENFKKFFSDAVVIETLITSESTASVLFLFGPNLEAQETMKLQKIGNKWFLNSF